MGFELPLEGPLHAASFSIDAHKSGKKEKGKCSLHVEYIYLSRCEDSHRRCNNLILNKLARNQNL